jgi:hypothetical protein
MTRKTLTSSPSKTRSLLAASAIVAALAAAGCGSSSTVYLGQSAHQRSVPITYAAKPAPARHVAKPAPAAYVPNPSRRLTDNSTCNDWTFANAAATARYVNQPLLANVPGVQDSINAYCARELTYPDTPGASMHDRIANGLPGAGGDLRG